MTKGHAGLSYAAVTRGAGTRSEANVCRADCSVMIVTYIPAEMTVETEPIDDALEILVAAKDPLLYLRVPAVGVRHVGARDASLANEGQRSERVLISMDREFLRGQTGIELASHALGSESRCRVANVLVKALGDALLADFRLKRIPTPQYLQSVAGVIAEALAAHHYIDGKPAPSQGLSHRRLVSVLQYIEEHIDRYLQVSEIASTANMSPYHFARMFKLEVGLPPHCYVTTRRVEHAKRLLGETDESLVDVAAAVGFQTQGHFTTVFRKYAGTTPRSYRLAHAKASAVHVKADRAYPP